MTEYRIYHNVQTPFQPYARGDRLWFDATAYEVSVSDGVHDPVNRLLNTIFDRHNRDDRPDGQRAPSLSVGDIVALDWNNENATFWTVQPVGWLEVESPLYVQVVNAVAGGNDISYRDARR
jgi:hypothetical protein